MAKFGTRFPFDGAAQKALNSRLRRLDLQLSYHKLGIAAAFYAMREVIGELLISDSLDLRALPLLFWLSGGYPSCLAEFKPEARPASFQSPKFTDEFSREYPDAWVSDGEDPIGTARTGETFTSIKLPDATSACRPSSCRVLLP
jgi:hypothetical protein